MCLINMSYNPLKLSYWLGNDLMQVTIENCWFRFHKNQSLDLKSTKKPQRIFQRKKSGH